MITHKNKLSILLGVIFFSIFMLFEVSIDLGESHEFEVESINEIVTGLDEIKDCSSSISIGFLNAHATDPGEDGGDGDECTAIQCIEYKKCTSFAPCGTVTTCNFCTCTIRETAHGGSGNCG